MNSAIQAAPCHWVHVSSTLISLWFPGASLRFHFDFSPRLTSSSLRSQFCFRSVSIRFPHIEFTSISLRYHFEFISVSFRFHVDSTSISLRFHFGSHFDFISVSFRSHFDSTSGLTCVYAHALDNNCFSPPNNCFSYPTSVWWCFAGHSTDASVGAVGSSGSATNHGKVVPHHWPRYLLRD